jgi:hypothetical protein
LWWFDTCRVDALLFSLSDFSSVSFAVGGIVYEGVRELAGFLEFIKENAVHEYTLPEINHDEL